jgi:hypothetical protein
VNISANRKLVKGSLLRIAMKTTGTIVPQPQKIKTSVVAIIPFYLQAVGLLGDIGYADFIT